MQQLRLYFKLIGARIRAQMQYKLSFVLQVFGFALQTLTEFAVVAILLTRFQSLAGWSLAEVALLYGLISSSFGFAEMIARGFDLPFEQMIKRGSFDSVLIRPQDSFFQILAAEFQLRRIGRIAQALLVLWLAIIQLPIAWNAAHLILVLLSISGGTVVYIGITVIGASICFWTIKTPELINAFTAGGNTLASYPLEIYGEWVRNLFLFAVPVALMNYPTALILLERSSPFGLPAWLAWCSLPAALLFFGLARLIWALGVRHYTSAGS